MIYVRVDCDFEFHVDRLKYRKRMYIEVTIKYTRSRVCKGLCVCVCVGGCMCVVVCVYASLCLCVCVGCEAVCGELSMMNGVGQGSRRRNGSAVVPWQRVQNKLTRNNGSSVPCRWSEWPNKIHETKQIFFLWPATIIPPLCKPVTLFAIHSLTVATTTVVVDTYSRRVETRDYAKLPLNNF